MGTAVDVVTLWRRALDDERDRPPCPDVVSVAMDVSDLFGDGERTRMARRPSRTVERRWQALLTVDREEPFGRGNWRPRRSYNTFVDLLQQNTLDYISSNVSWESWSPGAIEIAPSTMAGLLLFALHGALPLEFLDALATLLGLGLLLGKRGSRG